MISQRLLVVRFMLGLNSVYAIGLNVFRFKRLGLNVFMLGLNSSRVEYWQTLYFQRGKLFTRKILS